MHHGQLQLVAGSIIGDRFEIERAAGSGGMGTVYRARDRQSGGWVALKLIHSGSSSPAELERFAREADLLAQLRHPGIVGHIASGLLPDGQRFLAMEWLDGHELSQRLGQAPLELADCLALMTRVASALSVAHRNGIVHRDLKPGNLFLPGGDIAQAKILDFGIARRGFAAKAMTQTGLVVGTPPHLGRDRRCLVLLWDGRWASLPVRRATPSHCGRRDGRVSQPPDSAPSLQLGKGGWRFV